MEEYQEEYKEGWRNTKKNKRKDGVMMKCFKVLECLKF